MSAKFVYDPKNVSRPKFEVKNKQIQTISAAIKNELKVTPLNIKY